MDKFNTLTHNGPVFPDEYEVKGFKLNGEKLPDLAEEMMWQYAAKRDTDYVKMDLFNKNFYKCLKPELTASQQKLEFPKDYKDLIDEMFNKNQEMKEAKKLYNKEHKEEIAQHKEEMKEEYGYAMLNGKKQPLGSYMIEGPGIIITRGDSNIIGMWKYRTVPEDVTINYVSKDMSKAPKAPEGHNWKEVISDKNSLQTVMYFVQIGRPEFGISPRYKRILFGASSSVKCKADMKKFEKARHLVAKWDQMEKYISDGLKSTDTKRKESALIAHLIQTTGIRVGNEKDENAGYADTVGASTLEAGNVTLKGNNIINLSFMGKDSVPYTKDVEISSDAYKAMKEVKAGKKDHDMLFEATSADVSSFLKEFMPECSPKLFRSAYGCKLISEELKKAEKEGNLTKNMTQNEKLHVYDLANLAVAKKLNHQKAISKNFNGQMEKLDEQIEKAIAKENETKSKAKADLKKILEQTKLAKQTWEGDKLKEKLAQFKERKNKIQARVEKAENRIEDLKTKKEFKGMTANYALGTSRTNYSTPALAVSFCKKFDIDISKIYSKTLLKKFEWALDTPVSYYDNFPNEAKN